MLRRLAASSLALPLLVLLCLGAFLPGLFSIPPIDRDESRFAQASRQMFESVALPAQVRDPVMHGGGLAVPYVQSKPRLNKPPLVYWLQSASAAILTGGEPLEDAIWMYRVPGVLCAIGAVLATWRFVLSMYAGMPDARTIAWIAGAGLALSPVVVIDAHQARADQLLLLTVVLTQWMLWKIVSGDRRLLVAMAFWLFLALGVLAKGPITPLIAALTALAWSLARREWRWLVALRPLIGAMMVALVVGPWVYAVAAHVGFENYWRTIWNETIGRSVEGQEGHWGPPGYHLLLLFFLLWPVSLGVPGAMVVFWKCIRGERSEGFLAGVRRASVERPRDAFLLAWVLPGWILFELVSTKLPHYTLPLFPALSILGASWLVEVGTRASAAGFGAKPSGPFLHWTRVWFGTGIAVLGAIGALTLSLSWWETLGWWKGADADPTIPRTSWVLVVPIALMLVCMWKSGRELAGLRTVEAVGLACCAAMIGFGLLLGVVAPAALSLSTRIVAAIERREPVSLVGYGEDSMIFLTRGRAVRRSEGEAPPGIVVQSVPAETPAGPGVKLLRGFNIAKGRCESVIVFPLAGGTR